MQKLRVSNISISLDGYVTGFNTDRHWGSDDGVGEDFAEAGDASVGATIMGPDMSSRVAPPYHHPVFVVTDGIEAALEQAFDAANGADVRIAGGASTIQQYLHARLVDEMHFVIVPMLIGTGERLFDNLDGAMAGYECVELTPSPSGVVHVRIARSPTGGG